MNSTDCYKILDLPFGASHKEVRAARRNLMMQWHPDRVDHNPALKEIATEKSKEINRAAEFLLSLSEPSAQAPSATQEQSKAAPSSGSESSTSQEQAKGQARQKQAAQDAEAKRKKQEDEEAQREAERQAQAAQRTAERQAEEEAAEAQRSEQLSQQKINATKAKRKRVLIVTGMLAVCAWQHFSSTQVSSDQQETPATSSQLNVSERNEPVTAPGDAANVSWLDVSKEWCESDHGRRIIGIDRDHLHSILGQPSLTFAHQASTDVHEEMWLALFGGDCISVVFKGDRVIQVETTISNMGDVMSGAKVLLLSEIKKGHAVLHVSAYRYDASKEFATSEDHTEPYNDSAEKHFQSNATTYYYDDVSNGIAFSQNSRLL